MLWLDLETSEAEREEAGRTVISQSTAYKTAHKRLRKELGPTSAHPCAECAAPALDWAYLHPTGWSEDPGDYEPLCRSCHKKRDTVGRLDALLEAGREDARSAEGRARRSKTMQRLRAEGRVGNPPRDLGKRQCLTCAMITTPGPMANHLRASGHGGYLDLV